MNLEEVDYTQMEFQQFQQLLNNSDVRREMEYSLYNSIENKKAEDKLKAMQGKTNVSWEMKNRRKVGQLTSKQEQQIIKRTLDHADKNLMIKIKNGELTLDQIQARLSFKYYGVTYKVLDDLKEVLHPQIFKGFENDEEFLALFNKTKGQTVTPHEILNRPEYFSNQHCIRSLHNQIGREKYAAQFWSSAERKLHGYEPPLTRCFKRNVVQLRPKAHTLKPDLSEENYSQQKFACRLATRIVAILSETQRKYITENPNQQKVMQELSDCLRHLLVSHGFRGIDEAKYLAFFPSIYTYIKFKIRTQHFHSEEVREALNKDNQTDLQERISRDKNLCAQLKFLKKLEDLQEDNGEKTKIIWNKQHKEMFEKLETEQIKSRRIILGLEKSQKSEKELEEDMFKKKPRPNEIMNEVKMVGKYGTQAYSKKVIKLDSDKTNSNQSSMIKPLQIPQLQHDQLSTPIDGNRTAEFVPQSRTQSNVHTTALNSMNEEAHFVLVTKSPAESIDRNKNTISHLSNEEKVQTLIMNQPPSTDNLNQQTPQMARETSDQEQTTLRIKASDVVNQSNTLDLSENIKSLVHPDQIMTIQEGETTILHIKENECKPVSMMSNDNTIANFPESPIQKQTNLIEGKNIGLSKINESSQQSVMSPLKITSAKNNWASGCVSPYRDGSKQLLKKADTFKISGFEQQMDILSSKNSQQEIANQKQPTLPEQERQNTKMTNQTQQTLEEEDEETEEEVISHRLDDIDKINYGYKKILDSKRKYDYQVKQDVKPAALKKEQSISPKEKAETDFMNLFKRIDLNNVTPEMLNYLRSNDSLYQSKNLEFVKSTLLGLSSGQMMSITSTQPMQSRFGRNLKSAKVKNDMYVKNQKEETLVNTVYRLNETSDKDETAKTIKNLNRTQSKMSSPSLPVQSSQASMLMKNKGKNLNARLQSSSQQNKRKLDKNDKINQTMKQQQLQEILLYQQKEDKSANSRSHITYKKSSSKDRSTQQATADLGYWTQKPPENVQIEAKKEWKTPAGFHTAKRFEQTLLGSQQNLYLSGNAQRIREIPDIILSQKLENLQQISATFSKKLQSALLSNFNSSSSLNKVNNSHRAFQIPLSSKELNDKPARVTTAFPNRKSKFGPQRNMAATMKNRINERIKSSRQVINTFRENNQGQLIDNHLNIEINRTEGGSQERTNDHTQSNKKSGRFQIPVENKIDLTQTYILQQNLNSDRPSNLLLEDEDDHHNHNYYGDPHHPEKGIFSSGLKSHKHTVIETDLSNTYKPFKEKRFKIKSGPENSSKLSHSRSTLHEMTHEEHSQSRSKKHNISNRNSKPKIGLLNIQPSESKISQKRNMQPSSTQYQTFNGPIPQEERINDNIIISNRLVRFLKDNHIPIKYNQQKQLQYVDQNGACSSRSNKITKVRSPKEELIPMKRQSAMNERHEKPVPLLTHEKSDPSLVAESVLKVKGSHIAQQNSQESPPQDHVLIIDKQRENKEHLQPLDSQFVSELIAPLLNNARAPKHNNLPSQRQGSIQIYDSSFHESQPDLINHYMHAINNEQPQNEYLLLEKMDKSDPSKDPKINIQINQQKMFSGEFSSNKKEKLSNQNSSNMAQHMVATGDNHLQTSMINHLDSNKTSKIPENSIPFMGSNSQNRIEIVNIEIKDHLQRKNSKIDTLSMTEDQRTHMKMYSSNLKQSKRIKSAAPKNISVTHLRHQVSALMNDRNSFDDRKTGKMPKINSDLVIVKQKGKKVKSRQ